MGQSSANPNLLPDGAEIDRMRHPVSGKPITYEKIGQRYGVSRQAVHKAHAKWRRAQAERAELIEIELPHVTATG